MTTELVLIAVLVFGIGVSLGVSGLGGFLVPALLVAVLAMDPATAVAHGLISFVIPGIIGSWMYWRKDNRPSWWVTILLCVGTVPGLLLGRWISVTASQQSLQVILASIVLASGIILLLQRRRPKSAAPERIPGPRVVAPAATGAGILGGVSTVLAGVGGPLITVPVLIALGLELTPVVGAGLLNSVFGVALGAVSLVGTVHLQPVVLAVITGAQLIGVPVGARLQDRMDARRLVPIIASAAVATALWLLIRVFT